MKVKLDENLGSRAIKLFRESGYEISTVSEQDLDGTSDDEPIEACRAEGRVLVTLDLDFSNVLRFPHPVELGTIRERVRVLLWASKQKDLSGRLRIVEQDWIRKYDSD